MVQFSKIGPTPRRGFGRWDFLNPPPRLGTCPPMLVAERTALEEKIATGWASVSSHGIGFLSAAPMPIAEPIDPIEAHAMLSRPHRPVEPTDGFLVQIAVRNLVQKLLVTNLIKGLPCVYRNRDAT